MGIDEVVNLLKDTGVTIGMLIYFCWRDCKYMQKIEETLDVLKAYIVNDKKDKE